MGVLKKLSKIFFDVVNNIVDNDKSEYYKINKRKRNFWHSQSTTISCRVRNKNSFNNAPEMAANIRAFLLDEEKYFLNVVSAVMKYIHNEDGKQFKNFIYAKHPNVSKEELDEKMGLLVLDLDDNEKKEVLGLQEVVSCRLLGYEKELFYLKCFSFGILPVFMLRVLYHTKYSHLKLKRMLEVQEDLYKGIDFNHYLEKIRFL